jgi:hypothetical protein
MSPTRRDALKRGAGIALAAAGLAGCAEFVRDFIYFPPASDPALPLAGEPERITVDTADGLRLVGAQHRPAPGKPVILFFHGNASDLAGVSAWLRGIEADGVGVMMAEYRGYFGNPGAPSEAGLAQDARAFHAAAASLAGGADRVIIVGHSLGGGVAFGLSTAQTSRGLMTIGTFTATTDVAPPLTAPLVPDRFANREALAKLTAPLLIAHGDKDDVIPFSHAERLAAAAHEAGKPGAFLTLAGVGHSPDRAMMRALLLSGVTALDVGAATAFTDGRGGVGAGFGPWRTT